MKKGLLFLVLSLMLIFTLSVVFADEEVTDLITEPVQLFTPAEGVELDVSNPENTVDIEPTGELEKTENPANDEEIPAVLDGVDTTTPTNEIVPVEPISDTSSNQPASVVGAIIAIVIIVVIIAVVALLQK